jgi:hypothetical protein
MVRKPHAFPRQGINIWGFNFGLTVGTKLAVAEVVGENINDIWP